MSGSESSKATSLWPKLLLWGAVILAGFLYLGSISDKRGGGTDAESSGAPAVEISSAGDAVPSGGASVSDASPSSEPTVDRGPEAQVATEPARQAEVPDLSDRSNVSEVSSPFEATDVPLYPMPGPSVAPAPERVAAPEPEPAPAVPDDASVPAQQPVSGEPGLQTAGPDSDHRPIVGAGEERPAPVVRVETPEQPVPEAPAASAEDSAALAREEAKAFAETVINEEAGQPATAGVPVTVPQAAAAVPDTATEGAEAGVPAAATSPSPAAAQESPAESRARIMAEYEAMRRRAQEEMRRYWGQGPAQGKYPVYPGYAPGYLPQRQP